MDKEDHLRLAELIKGQRELSSNSEVKNSQMRIFPGSPNKFDVDKKS